MVMVMVMVVIMLFFGRRIERGSLVARYEFVQKIWLLGCIAYEAHAHLFHSSHLGAYLLPDHIFNAARLVDGPRAGYAKLDVHKVVLAGLDTLNSPDVDGLSCCCDFLDSLDGCLPNIVFHLLVYAHVCQFQQCLLRVAPSCLNDHKRNNQTSNRVEPLGVVENI